MIFAGTIYSSGIDEPQTKTGKFTEMVILKGRVHYITQIQFEYYQLSHYAAITTFPAGIFMFLLYNLLERRLRNEANI
jgi:hypothetical protein